MPPEVTVPTTASGAETACPPSMRAVIATISASYLTTLGHRSECSGLAWENIA